jgi:hypothetical protein
VVVRDCDTVQAGELVRALRQQPHEMTTRLARVERQDAIDVSELLLPASSNRV